MEITFGNQAIKLLPSGALVFTQQQVLVAADLHLGKMLALQDLGVPGHVFADLPTIQKLSHDISVFQPKKLILLGDVFHQKSRHMHQLVNWFFETLRPLVPLVIVTLGNHDRHLLTEIQVAEACYVSVYEWEGIHFSHEPLTDVLCMAGHIHPGITIKKGKLTKSFKAFFMNKQQLILPAYGKHTGISPLTYPFQKAFIIKDKTVQVMKKNSL